MKNVKVDKFKEWFEKFSLKTDGNYSNSDYGYIAKESWDTCKNEILKIIDKQKIYGMPDDELVNSYLDKEDLIYEIEKL